MPQETPNRTPQQDRCPQCGRPMPSGSPRGLCPACLLKCGLETNTAGYTEESDGRRRWTPPPPDALAELFPELEVIELIGRGGMGAVYKAREKELDRLVALKILPPDLAAPGPSRACRGAQIGREPAFAERFAREARAMAKLNHPNIVTIHSFGSRPLTAGGRRDELYFFIMEYVDGLSLRALLDRGTVSPPEALAIVPQICDALQYAHDRGIVHRDIKPENILLNRAGDVKIADFGLARLVGGAQPFQAVREQAGKPVPPSPGVTQDGERVCGTPHYMAPEQIERPREVDHRADIYSLGVVFYQMLTGELPKGSSSREFAPPSRKVLIDVRLDEVVLRALEREPARRYQQVSEVRTQVETIVGSPGQATGEVTRHAATSGEPRFSRLALLGAACIGVGVIGVGTVLELFYNYRPELRPPNAPAWWQIPFKSKGTALAGLAFLAAAFCGAVSISQIRHSAGRLYGLGLALFDTLLLPLLILNSVILVAAHGLAASHGPAVSTPGGGSVQAVQYNGWIMALGVVLCGVLDVVIARWAWRAAKRPPGQMPNTAPQPPAYSPETAAPQIERARQAVKAPAIGLLVTGLVHFAVLAAGFLWMLLNPEHDPRHPLVVGRFLGVPYLFSAAQIPVLLVAIASYIIILLGTVRMMHLRNRGLAILSAILAITSVALIAGAALLFTFSVAAMAMAKLAVLGNIIGLPMGIWALVVLSRREVVEAFKTSGRPVD